MDARQAASQPIFIANCYLHETAQLSRRDFLDRVQHIQAIRSSSVPVFTSYPTTEEEWDRIAALHHLVATGTFDTVELRRRSHPVALAIPRSIYFWFKNTTLDAIQRQVVLSLAHLYSWNMDRRQLLRDQLHGRLLTRVLEVHEKFFRGLPTIRSDENLGEMDVSPEYQQAFEQAYKVAARDYVKGASPEILLPRAFLEMDAEYAEAGPPWVRPNWNLDPPRVFPPNEFDFMGVLSYFTEHDWNSHVLLQRKPPENHPSSRRALQLDAEERTQIRRDSLWRVESSGEAWEQWLATFQQFPRTGRFIYELMAQPMPSGWVYLIRDTQVDKYKIGWTGEGVENRLRTLQTGNPHRLELIGSFPATSKRAESAIHEHFSGKRGLGEWFDLSSQDVENILSSVWRGTYGIF